MLLTAIIYSVYAVYVDLTSNRILRKLGELNKFSRTKRERKKISLWAFFLINFDGKCMASANAKEENHEIFENNQCWNFAKR